MSRSWESWWERDGEVNFMRRPGAENHPIRVRMSEEAAKVGGSVLDVGCATGIDYPRLKRLGLKYTGVDVTNKFILRAKELYPEIDVRVANALDLPFSDGSFDVVFSNGMIQHLAPNEYPKALREMWRVARKLLLVSTNRQFIYSDAELISKMNDEKGAYVNNYNFWKFMEHLNALPDADVNLFQGFMTMEDRMRPGYPFLRCPKCKAILSPFLNKLLMGWDKCWSLFIIYNKKLIQPLCEGLDHG